MNKNKLFSFSFVVAGLIAAPLFTACSDDNTPTQDETNNLVPGDTNFGKDTGNFTADEWYPGGKLGTVELASYSTDAPAVAEVADGDRLFNLGETFFERSFTENSAPFKGLGPAWVRNSCIKCHPNYGHGRRQDAYNADTYGNGYLLVVYHPTAGVDANGNAYPANQYITEVTGMPQTRAMRPFKAPIDESGIHINWKTVEGTMPSGLSASHFPDGEEFTLIYPEVTIDQAAFNTDPKPDNYEVRLESTIGIYGTGLLDAIDADEMKKQYQKEAEHAELNPEMWDKATNDWASKAWYTLADGTKGIKKFTYAMTRTSLQDGPGANAIWNITNVTRSDRHYFYSTAAWAKAMSEDPEVISYIKANGAKETSVLHPYWANTDEGIKENVNNLLSLSGNNDATHETFKKYFVDGAPYNGQEEMSDADYYAFMVWHRGIGVPAARNLNDSVVQKGKELFTNMGCVRCHRPSWKTGEDNYWVDNAIKAYAAKNNLDVNKMLPKYANQTIWPYTDLVQHRLHMANDIRTGWCRTTPLWGRGLSLQITGAEDRLHDCRARNEIEAIMWHAYSADSDAFFAAKQFYNLPKADRDAVVKFLRSI